MATVTRSDVPAEVNNFYNKTLLVRAKPRLVYTNFGQVKDIPQKAGSKTIKFRRYESLSPATTPLTEGVTLALGSLTQSVVTGDVKQYGHHIETSDVLSYESIDNTLTETAELLGEQAGNKYFGYFNKRSSECRYSCISFKWSSDSWCSSGRGCN